MTLVRVVAAVTTVGLAGVTAILYVGFGAFLPWRENAEAARLADLIGVKEGQTVAEIGAGGGRFTVALAARVGAAGRVYASELPGATHQALVARTAGIGNITVVEAERTKTRLPDGCCDLVLMRNMYHHVTDPAAFVNEVRRAVRPNGLVVIIDFEPGALWFHGGRPDDAATRRAGHGVSQRAAAVELEAAGFRLERDEPQWRRPMWMSMFRRVD
jgi:ubiquinone/menaquinone biosynthesis C-methylase UbiE